MAAPKRKIKYLIPVPFGDNLKISFDFFAIGFHYLIIVTFVTISAGLVGAAQDDTFPSKTGVNCIGGNAGVNCDKVATPFIKPTPRQSERLTQFINWLFGPPDPARKLLKQGDEKSQIAGPDFEANATSSISNNDNGKSEARNKRSIEITDIQASIGTEVDTSKLSGDPSQVNLKEELETVEEFEKSQQLPRTKKILPRKSASSHSRRLKRDPYKPVKVPYVTTPTPDKNLNNLFQKRQLLMNPLDPQHQAIMALQQQQAAAAAAALIHRQQMDSILNGGSRISSILDDYDRDDDDSDEESDEFDDFSKHGIHNPMEHHHIGPFYRAGLPPPIPPPHPFLRKVGWGLGRRSLTDKESKTGQSKKKSVKGRNRGGKPGRPASLKSGKWFLDDYDLNSEFFDRPYLRKNTPEHLLDAHDETLELDEEEHHARHNQENYDDESQETKSNLEHLEHKGDLEYIYREFKDSLCKGNECLQSRQMTSSTTGGSSSTTGGSSSTTGGTGSSSTTGGTGSSTTTGGTGSSSTTGGTGSSSTTGGTGSSTTGGSSSSTTRRTTTTTRRTTTTTRRTTTATTPKPKPPYKATLNCRCGTQSVRGEGIGEGVVVRFNVNPWLVAISNSSGHMCSGSIINDRFILTSKQCVRSAKPQSLTVTAGLTSKMAVNYTVSKITVNPKVNIALLQLNSTIKPSHRMRPVCLPIGKRYAGQYSTGMIITFKKGTPPTTLQMVDTEVAIMNGTNCSSKAPGTFCAGPPGSIKCGGDTGGVLMVYRGGYSYEQIGVVAGTVGCRATKTPGVYTGKIAIFSQYP